MEVVNVTNETAREAIAIRARLHEKYPITVATVHIDSVVYVPDVDCYVMNTRHSLSARYSSIRLSDAAAAFILANWGVAGDLMMSMRDGEIDDVVLFISGRLG